MTRKSVCIFHKDCPDGLASAWLVRRHERMLGGEPIMFGMGYDDPAPDAETFRDARVWIVDFSVPPDALTRIADVATVVTVLDHHKTAVEKYAGFVAPDNVTLRIEEGDLSGVGMVAAFLGVVLSPLLEAIQDRDLWKFALPYTKPLCAALRARPLSFDALAELSPLPIGDLIVQGEAVLAYETRLVDDHERRVWSQVIASVTVPAVMCSLPQIVSELGHSLCDGAPFAAVCAWEPDGRALRVSLRSREDGADVSEIAKRFGGGGHPHAAGFTLRNGSVALESRRW